eukprot:Opistho-2@73499
MDGWKHFALTGVVSALALSQFVLAAPSCDGGACATDGFNGALASNGTADGGDDSKSALKGYLAAVVAVLFFGSNFVPVKKFDTGDGMFFQWVMCAAIWCEALIVASIQGYPKFEPLAMFGGFLWCTGNITVVPVVKMIGLSLGMLIWGSTNLIGGWASGRFGLFGLDKQVPKNNVMNGLGVAICVVSIFVYMLVDSKGKETKEAHYSPAQVQEESEALLYDKSSAAADNDAPSDESWVDKLNPTTKRILGYTLAAVAGLFYGFNFDPVQYIIDNRTGASQNGLDYVFSHFCGIFLTSTVYFLAYCAYMRNRPKVYPRIILPAFISGVMWAIADTAWFIANQNLTQTISFPIITTGPGIVASLWGIIAFGEIRGMRNFIVLGSAFALTFTGVALTAVSK